MTQKRVTHKKVSAGCLLFRRREGGLEFLLAHPGGPFYSRKDEGVWSIPKGEIENGEEPQAAAVREFEEETGVTPEGRLIELGTVLQRGGKLVYAWAFEGDCDTGEPPPGNHFEMEWPPRSGQSASFPEIDRVEFFDPATARRKILPAQSPFLDRLTDACQT